MVQHARIRFERDVSARWHVPQNAFTYEDFLPEVLTPHEDGPWLLVLEPIRLIHLPISVDVNTGAEHFGDLAAQCGSNFKCVSLKRRLWTNE